MQNLKKTGPRAVLVYFIKILLIAGVYFLSAKLGLQFAFFKENVTLIWPPSGIALAALLLMGSIALPGIVLGVISVSYSTGSPLVFTLINAVGNSLAAIIPWLLIKRMNSFRPQLNNLGSVIALLTYGALLGPLLSSLFGSAGILLAGQASWVNIGDICLKWWLGDSLGVVFFSPFLLTWFNRAIEKNELKRKFEGLLIIFCLIILDLLIFNNKLSLDISFSLSTLIFPLAIWTALRLDSRGVTMINLIAMSISVWATINGHSPLINFTVQSGLIYVSSTSTIYITALILSSAIAERKSLEKELTNQSNHDHLTGLYNRLFFDVEMERLNDSRQFPISVIMTDVDQLKRVNDTLGHDQGDQVLINVAALFNRVFRKEDIVARLSGDEFAILLPNTNLPSLRKILKRAHSEISLFNQAHHKLPIHLSIGYCRAHKNNRIEDCLKKADKLMYLEKQKKLKRK